MQKILVILLFVLIFTPNIHAEDLFLLQDNCVRCHLTCEKKTRSNSVLTWKKSVHFGPDSGCSDCHGGDKYLYLDFQKNHIGLPNSAAANTICGSCHAEEYKDFRSRKNQPLSNQAGCEANCIICHGYHDIQKADLSIINPSNCGKCHPFNKAKNLTDIITKIQSSLDTIETRIARKKAEKFPFQTAERQLSEIRLSLASAFHKMSSHQLIDHLKGDIRTSITQLESQMEITSPRNWTSQGLKVIIFLAVCIFLIMYYQRSITRK